MDASSISALTGLVIVNRVTNEQRSILDIDSDNRAITADGEGLRSTLEFCTGECDCGNEWVLTAESMATLKESSGRVLRAKQFALLERLKPYILECTNQCDPTHPLNTYPRFPLGSYVTCKTEECEVPRLMDYGEIAMVLGAGIKDGVPYLALLICTGDANHAFTGNVDIWRVRSWSPSPA